MSIDIFAKYLGILFFFVLLQVLLFNNIQLTALGLTPYVYVVFILLIPFDTPGWLLLLFAFALGIFVDIFDDTGGVHASASVFAAFARPLTLRILAPRDGYESGYLPRVSYMGFVWFLKYAIIMVFLHHIIYFYLEAFSFDHFFYTLLNTILTLIFSVVVIMISQYLIFRK